MAVIQRNKSAYGLSDPIFDVFNPPIISNRNPLASDLAPIGTLWINKSANAAFILTSIVGGAANWADFSGGAGVFTSLTVNPGPTNLSTVGSGAVNIGNAANAGAINIEVGPGDFSLSGNGNIIAIGNDAAANDVIIGTNTAGAQLLLEGGNGTGVNTAGIIMESADTGDIQIGSTTHTGVIYVGVSTAVGGDDVLIGASAAANVVTVGSLTGAATTTIQGGTGGIALNAAGQVSMAPATNTAASPTATVTIDARVGQAVFTGFTTAAAAAQVFTIQSNQMLSSSALIVSAMNAGANDAQMTITRVNPASGSFNVTLVNNGAAALNGTVYITFWILD